MNSYIRKSFKASEVACRCGCGMLPTEEALDALQALRDEWDEPLVVTSGARCKAHNEKVGGAKDSQHLKGVAFDVVVTGSRERLPFIEMALGYGFTAFGINKAFIHIDMRPLPPGETMLFLY